MAAPFAINPQQQAVPVVVRYAVKALCTHAATVRLRFDSGNMFPPCSQQYGCAFRAGARDRGAAEIPSGLNSGTAGGRFYLHPQFKIRPLGDGGGQIVQPFQPGTAGIYL